MLDDLQVAKKRSARARKPGRGAQRGAHLVRARRPSNELCTTHRRVHLLLFCVGEGTESAGVLYCAPCARSRERRDRARGGCSTPIPAAEAASRRMLRPSSHSSSTLAHDLLPNSAARRLRRLVAQPPPRPTPTPAPSPTLTAPGREEAGPDAPSRGIQRTQWCARGRGAGAESRVGGGSEGEVEATSARRVACGRTAAAVGLASR